MSSWGSLANLQNYVNADGHAAPLFSFSCQCPVNLFHHVHDKTCSRPSTWMVAAFYPVLGVESLWDERGGNSNSVRNVELMIECNDCLFEGWNDQTCKTHIERWPDQSDVETHIVRIGHIQDKPEGDKMLGDPRSWCLPHLHLSSCILSAAFLVAIFPSSMAR